MGTHLWSSLVISSSSLLPEGSGFVAYTWILHWVSPFLPMVTTLESLSLTWVSPEPSGCPQRAWEEGYCLSYCLEVFQTNRNSVGDCCWNMTFCSSGISHFIDVFLYLRLSVILVTTVQYLGTLTRALHRILVAKSIDNVSTRSTFSSGLWWASVWVWEGQPCH